MCHAKILNLFGKYWNQICPSKQSYTAIYTQEIGNLRAKPDLTMTESVVESNPVCTGWRCRLTAASHAQGPGHRQFRFPPGGESPLRAALSSSDAVTLDIFWANLPAEGPDFDARLWRFIQEDRVDPELRSRLMQNGLRAGVVGGAPPGGFARCGNDCVEFRSIASARSRRHWICTSLPGFGRRS